MKNRGRIKSHRSSKSLSKRAIFYVNMARQRATIPRIKVFSQDIKTLLSLCRGESEIRPWKLENRDGTESNRMKIQSRDRSVQRFENSPGY